MASSPPFDVDHGTIIRHDNAVAGLRGEAGFRITGEVLYGTLSNGGRAGTVVKKVDLQVDELVGDLGLRWRLIDGSIGLAARKFFKLGNYSAD